MTELAPPSFDSDQYEYLIPTDFGTTRTISCREWREFGPPGELFLRTVLKTQSFKRPATVLSCLCTVKVALTRGIRATSGQSFPDTINEWQELINASFTTHLHLATTENGLRSRIRSWNSVIAPALRHLRDIESLIPTPVQVPRPEESGHPATKSRNRGAPEHSPPSISNSLLSAETLHRKDPAFLNALETDLSKKIRGLETCLSQWWAMIESHFSFGASLLRTSKPLHSSSTPLKARQPAEPLLLNGVISANNMAAILRSTCARHSGIFRAKDNVYLVNYCDLDRSFPELFCPPRLRSVVTKSRRISWMLGNLTNFDIAIIASLLVINHPSLTPHALLTTKHTGVDLDESTGNQHGQLTVTKHRAHSAQYIHLNPTTSAILGTLLQIREHIVAVQRQFQSAPTTLNNLFVVAGNKSFAPVSPNNVSRSFSSELNLHHFFPSLYDIGIDEQDLSLTRIRRSMGILEWFQSGSLHGVAHVLGNTKKVSLKYYLPAQVVDAWNARVVRRFQNLLIFTAAPNGYQLQATDFSTLEELVAFLSDMLSLLPSNSSPMAKALHLKGHAFLDDLNIPTTTESHSSSQGAGLAVNVSEGNLYALYCFEDALFQSDLPTEFIDHPHPDLGCSAVALSKLSRLLRKTLHNHRDPVLRQAHTAAKRLIEESSTPNPFRFMLTNLPET